jgi:DNA-binding NtrC family response regulator
MPGGLIEPEQLSPDLAAPPASGTAASHPGAARPIAPGHLGSAVERVERDMITVTLAHAGGNISETARVLGLTRRGLYLKMRRLGLDGVAADT